MSGYEVRELLPADEPAVLRLLADSLAGGPTGRRTAESFRWKHRDNPFGPSPGWVAVAGGRVVGVRLLLRWELLRGDEVVPAVRMVDTATAPDWQGRGVFKRLTLHALSTLPADVVVFNTPNTQSLPGYLRMGWSVVGRVPLQVRPVRPVRLASAVARGRVGQRRVLDVSPPVRSDLPSAVSVLAARADEVTALLRTLPRAPGLTTRRTLPYLQWRYGPGSGLDYRAVVVERAGRLTGLGLGRVRYRGPLRELTLGDVLAVETGAARAVLRRSARGSDIDHVVTTAPGRAAAGALAAGFVRAPRAGLLLTAGPGSARGERASLAGWELALGDLELF